jgi:hypothetical protein
MNSSLKTFLKILIYILVPFIIFLLKWEFNLPIGWVAVVFLILGYQFMLKDEFISNEKKYFNYLNKHIKISDEGNLKNAITSLFKKDYNNMKDLFEKNPSDIVLKYLMIQNFIIVEKNYSYLDELIKIQNNNQEFGDIMYLILLCNKNSNDLLNYQEVKSKLYAKHAFLFKNQVNQLQ